MRIIGIFAALAGMSGPALAECRADLVRVEGAWGHANFAVELADTNEERALGLMNRERMGMLEGMLFIYDAPQYASFWMQNTLIPLDMLFIHADGTIATIHPDAIPLDTTAIPGGNDIKFVLEINGGLAARLGIVEGDAIQHPAVGSGAILPCEG